MRKKRRTIAGCVSLFCLTVVFGNSAFAQFRDNKSVQWAQLKMQLREHPDDPVLLTKAANSIADGLEGEQAMAMVQKAIKVKPDLPEAYLVRGKCFRNEMKFAEAESDFLKAIDLCKKRKVDAKVIADADFQAKGSLAEVYCDQKKYATALPLYRELANKTKWAYLYAAAANCEIKLKMDKEAETDLLLAQKLAPKNCEYFAAYGQMLIDRKDYEKAVQAYSKAIEFALAEGRSLAIRKHYKYYERRAFCYEQLGKKELASKDLRKFEGWKDSLYDVVPDSMK